MNDSSFLNKSQSQGHVTFKTLKYKTPTVLIFFLLYKSSLADCERLLAQHELVQEEIAHANPRYQALKAQGEKQVKCLLSYILF